MSELTDNQKRGLDFFDGFTREQLMLWARDSDSGKACMELLGARLKLRGKDKDDAPRG